MTSPGEGLAEPSTRPAAKGQNQLSKDSIPTLFAASTSVRQEHVAAWPLDCTHTWNSPVEVFQNPFPRTERLIAHACEAAPDSIKICPTCNSRDFAVDVGWFFPIGVLPPEFYPDALWGQQPPSDPGPALNDPGSGRATLRVELQSPPPRVPAPWVFQGNGGKGVITWLSETHVLEINPRWLNFSLFDSMDMNMTEAPRGPAQPEPQEWRNTFTVGLSTDWYFTRKMALSAGYRFYENPVPSEISAGAYPNASQHVIALAMRLSGDRHSVALLYGLDLMDAASSTGIMSARQGEGIDPLAHLVSLRYGFSF